jgi:hypothetical protein
MVMALFSLQLIAVSTPLTAIAARHKPDVVYVACIELTGNPRRSET